MWEVDRRQRRNAIKLDKRHATVFCCVSFLSQLCLESESQTDQEAAA